MTTLVCGLPSYADWIAAFPDKSWHAARHCARCLVDFWNARPTGVEAALARDGISIYPAAPPVRPRRRTGETARGPLLTRAPPADRSTQAVADCLDSQRLAEAEEIDYDPIVVWASTKGDRAKAPELVGEAAHRPRPAPLPDEARRARAATGKAWGER